MIAHGADILDVAIAGGGLSGLSLGFELKQRGLDIRVFEAAARPGGVIQTEQREGYLTECAAHGFLDKEPATRSLISRLGLEADLQPADAAVERRRYLFSRGALRLAPTSPSGFLKSNLLPLSARIRVLAELFIARPETVQDESVAQFARRRLGPRAAAVLVDAMQSGIYAGDPEKLSLEACFPALANMERTHRSVILGAIHSQKASRPALPPGAGGAAPLGRRLTSFKGGMGRLTDALGRALAADLECGQEVRSISRSEGLWRLELAGDRFIRSKALVLALPALPTANLVRDLCPPLEHELKGIPYAPLAVVHLGFRDTQVRDAPKGFGFLVPFEEGFVTLGTFFVDQFFPDRAAPGTTLFTCMMGGMRRRDAILEASPESLFARAKTELSRAVCIEGAPAFTHLVRWERAIPQYEMGHLEKLRRIDQALTSLPGLHLTGNAYRGVGVNDCIRNAQELAPQVIRTLTP